MVEACDKVGWKSLWTITKFKDEDGVIAEMLRGGARIEDVVKQFPEAFLGEERLEGNIALNEGLQALIDLLAGLNTVTKWDNANARLGVGDSNAAESASQTGLQGASKTFKAMDTGYPQRTNQTCEWRATFGSSDANYSWQEFTVVNAAGDTGQNLNRKVADKGTKASGESWTLSLQITFS
ncbi:hypothetical protein G4O51_11930 [Candidatus Bathyarchaeota archaeon A05DMB-2]|nr:hypothetical protein [Candidatus Bathyarchaeota archaeon A05DMB-2]